MSDKSGDSKVLDKINGEGGLRRVVTLALVLAALVAAGWFGWDKWRNRSTSPTASAKPAAVRRDTVPLSKLDLYGKENPDTLLAKNTKLYLVSIDSDLALFTQSLEKHTEYLVIGNRVVSEASPDTVHCTGPTCTGKLTYWNKSVSLVLLKPDSARMKYWNEPAANSKPEQ